MSDGMMVVRVQGSLRKNYNDKIIIFHPLLQAYLAWSMLHMMKKLDGYHYTAFCFMLACFRQFILIWSVNTEKIAHVVAKN